MLGGIAPIIIFDFEAATAVNLASVFSGIPVLKDIVPSAKLPSIPLYLDEQLTGMYVDSQTKNIDVSTETEGNTTDPNPKIFQKNINSIITVNLIASQNSIGMALLTVLSDKIFSSLITTKYSITYLNKSVTLFNGLLHSFSTVQNSDNDLYNISIQFSQGKVNSTVQGLVSKIAQPFNGTVPGATTQ